MDKPLDGIIKKVIIDLIEAFPETYREKLGIRDVGYIIKTAKTDILKLFEEEITQLKKKLEEYKDKNLGVKKDRRE